MLQSFFNDIPVAHCLTHKHLGMYLDEKLNFGHYITEKIAKANKGIAVFNKYHKMLYVIGVCDVRGCKYQKTYIRWHTFYLLIFPNNFS